MKETMMQMFEKMNVENILKEKERLSNDVKTLTEEETIEMLKKIGKTILESEEKEALEALEKNMAIMEFTKETNKELFDKLIEHSLKEAANI